MATRDNKGNIVSLPSLSYSLNTLPNATSMSNVSLHPSMFAPIAKDSEAKLQKAFLTKTGSSLQAPNMQPASYAMPPSHPQYDAALMMRKPVSLRFSHRW
ncbi:hypothetical protein D9758_008135 [Tetrapyrgos nigripes]|uniref:Uncharacterized protein n=1 Tax=Tetrapyrgos nigripes TaxID=182062 RepID=A0A8H5GHB3_9AGAR|nr:hypothetical protein D9758_008135 [Tetrapyrgos nigripes]